MKKTKTLDLRTSGNEQQPPLATPARAKRKTGGPGPVLDLRTTTYDRYSRGYESFDANFRRMTTEPVGIDGEPTSFSRYQSEWPVSDSAYRVRDGDMVFPELSESTGSTGFRKAKKQKMPDVESMSAEEKAAWDFATDEAATADMRGKLDAAYGGTGEAGRGLFDRDRLYNYVYTKPLFLLIPLLTIIFTAVTTALQVPLTSQSVIVTLLATLV